MSELSVIDRLKKRRCYPIPLEDGDKVYIRSLTIGEIGRAAKLTDDEAAGFAVGCSLVDEKGAQCFPQLPAAADGSTTAETDKAYSARIMELMTDVGEDVLRLIGESVTKLRFVPSIEELRKNS